jgi:hypothetical protein
MQQTTRTIEGLSVKLADENTAYVRLDGLKVNGIEYRGVVGLKRNEKLFHGETDS